LTFSLQYDTIQNVKGRARKWKPYKAIEASPNKNIKFKERRNYG